MKTIDDLKISKKAKLAVKTWLEEWLNTFLAQADGKEGTVYRANFRESDFFYFTNCNDILLDNPEATGHEANTKILKRKRAIMHQLLIKTLLGTVKLLKNKCSHCGYEDRYIDGLPNGTGHFLFCPNCFYTTIATYPNGYDTCIADVKKATSGKYLGTKKEDTPEKNCRTCKFWENDANDSPCETCGKLYGNSKDFSNWVKK